MKSVVKNVYYCDYCNKHYFSKYWAQQHEMHCTANPNRECKMCDLNGSHNIIPELLDKFYEHVKEKGTLPLFTTIVKETDNCPNCILTILRQFNKDPRFANIHEEHDDFGYARWSYSEELKAFWRQYNEEKWNY